jgi:hypothetical protein
MLLDLWCTRGGASWRRVPGEACARLGPLPQLLPTARPGKPPPLGLMLFRPNGGG